MDLLDELGISSSSSSSNHQEEGGSGADVGSTPSVCMDTSADASVPTRMDITGSSAAQAEEGEGASASSSPSEGSGKSSSERISEMVNRSRMSATDEAYRAAGRDLIPPVERERMVTTESTSFVTADLTRGEENRTLSSAVTAPGVPLSEADRISKGEEVPARARRTKRRRSAATEDTAGRKKKPRGSKRSRPPPEPVVHRVEDIPKEAVAPDPPVRKAREVEKHPGKVKTAGMGVAIPHPGDREGTLRSVLDASPLKRADNAPADPETTVANMVVEAAAHIPTASSSSSSRKRKAPSSAEAEGSWETASVSEVAGELDARRMGVGKDVDAGALVQPISQLKSAFADQNRITLEHMRAGLSRFFSGIIDKRLLEIQTASKELRDRAATNSGIAGDARSVRVPNTAASNGTSAQRRGERTLILNGTEEAIHELFRGSVPRLNHLSPFAQPGATGESQPALFLPRLGLGDAVDMPLDEAELSVLRGGSTIREAMVYFMSFDDSVAAMTSAYKTACEIAAVVSTTDALASPAVGGNKVVRRRMVKKLEEREHALGNEASNWSERFAIRVLRAILTGELRNQRHNIVRTLVAKQESLLELYREPAQRCFLDGNNTTTTTTTTNPQNGDKDADVIATLRRALGGDDDAGIPETAIPDLGAPASKAYCADFLRAVDSQNPLERPCAHSKWACVAWLAASHPSWPSTGALNRGARAFVMREFHPPDVWQRILQSRTLPEKRANCLMCSRFAATYMCLQKRMVDIYGVMGVRGDSGQQLWRGMLLAQSHCNEIDNEGGYTESDMLPMCRPTNGPWTGIVAPMVAYRANSYVLGESPIPINIHDRQRQCESSSSATAAATNEGKKVLPCFFERPVTDFH
jgi:hypothetical protein